METPRTNKTDFSLWKEILPIIKDVTWNKTGRNHEQKFYDGLFNGAYKRKPDDILVLFFSLDTEARIPPKYEDLLPKPWSEIEISLMQGEMVELEGKARDLNVIVLAAPTRSQLKPLIRQSKLLKALSGLDETSYSLLVAPSGRVKGPVIYTVIISEENWRKAKVSCQMETEGVLSLSMNNNGAPRVPDGHASFVHNLTAVDSEGNALPIKNFGDALWKVQPKENQLITLSYEVLLEHDKSDLPWGRDEAPYVTEDGAFWTGRALFIKTDMSDITVRFNLPEGWHVTTPWQPVANQPSTFLLEDEEDLTESFLFAGTHIEEQAKVGDTEIMLAVGNRMQKSKDLIQEAVQKFLNEYGEIFGSSPKIRTLIVVNHQDRRGSFDGGVFGRSISVLMGYEPTENNTQRWAPFIAHEVFHLWNGQIIKHSGQENWFSEGFTDYYAMVICARTGMIDEQEFIQRLKQACRQYLSKFGQTPIRKAREYALQYAGGSLVAASLDIQIRNLTNNTKSLDDLMQQMYLEFGRTSKKYALEDVIRLVNNITEKDHTGFFEQYVSGTNELPIVEYLSYIGLELKKKVTEELPEQAYVVHKMLRIQSLMHSGLVIRRSQEAGYQDEDRLIVIAGTPVNNINDVQTLAGSLRCGEKVSVGLLRDGKQITLEITVGGDQDNIPLERKVEISLEKTARLNNSQKTILSGITR